MVLAYLSAITGIDAKSLDSELALIAGEQERQKAISAAKTTLTGGLLKAGAAAASKIATKKPT